MRNFVKLFITIALVAIIGFLMTSCGAKCPGGGTSGGAENCQFSYDPADPAGLIQRYCEDLDCAVYKKALEFISNPLSFNSKITVTCNCK